MGGEEKKGGAGRLVFDQEKAEVPAALCVTNTVIKCVLAQYIREDLK